MSREMEKSMADIQRLLASKDFASEDELKGFLEQLTGQPLPGMPDENLSNEAQALELVYSAYKMPVEIGSAGALMALELDGDCIEAYEYFGNTSISPYLSVAYYERGITIGRKEFGGKYLEENKGHFWGLHETRAFMRCLYAYALSLYDIGKKAESLVILEEIIELNQNDNQGARYLLMLYLIESDERRKFKKYDKQYEESYSAFALFNRALFAFKTEGKTENANTLLAEAIAANKYVAAMLKSTRPMMEMPDYYGFGDKNEAQHYAYYAQDIWQETEGAADWLKKQTAKKKK